MWWLLFALSYSSLVLLLHGVIVDPEEVAAAAAAAGVLPRRIAVNADEDN